MGVILAIGNAIWEHEVGTRFQVYLPWDEAVDSAFFSGFLSFWSYIIILNTVVPISLYVRYALSPAGGLCASLPTFPGRGDPREGIWSPFYPVTILCYSSFPTSGIQWNRNYINLFSTKCYFIACSGQEVLR